MFFALSCCFPSSLSALFYWRKNLSRSGLQWHRSCHSNEMTPLLILLRAVFHGTGNSSFKIVHGSFFLQYPPRCSWSLREICKILIEVFWDEVFMVTNTLRTGQSWCPAAICRKCALEMQFYVVLVSIFLKTCVKNHEDSSSRLLERRIWLPCIESLLLVVL